MNDADVKLTSLRAYARHRKCQLKAVQDAIASGRLDASVTTDAKGTRKILDIALADREWADNTNVNKTPQARREKDAAMGLDGAGGASPVTQRRAPAASAHLAAVVGTPAPSDTPRRQRDYAGELLPPGVDRDPPEDEDQDEGVDGGGGESVSTTQARAAAEERAWKAKIAEVAYRKTAGELVDVSGIEAAMGKLVTNAKTRLMAVPSKARQKLPKLTRADVTVIEGLIREALEELAGPQMEGAAA